MRLVPIPIACALLSILLSSIPLLGCGPKILREPVFDSESVKVEVRSTVHDGETLPRGYAHPVTIADVRLAHILASISHEDSGGKRVPTVRSAHVYELAEGISKGLSVATQDQEVLALALSRDRRLGIFSTDRVTALGAHMEGPDLILEFYAIEATLEKDKGKMDDDGYEVPAELPPGKPSFRLIPGEGQLKHGARGLAVEWRHAYYRNPVSLRYRFGQVRRRTILMEDAEGGEVAAPPPPPPKDPDELSDGQLRALDQLEAARYAGYMTESEYQRRRRLVLRGELEEAGYGKDGE